MTPDERALLHAQERHDAALAECRSCDGAGECRRCHGFGYVLGIVGRETCDRCRNGDGQCVECEGEGQR